MYERHFGFTVKPFALTPDPAFLYPSRQHAMALTLLEYGLASQAAFSLLTGDIGSGKTTLVRKLLRQLGDHVAVGLVTNTHGRFKSVYGWALSALNLTSSDDSDVAKYEALVDSFVGVYAKRPANAADFRRSAELVRRGAGRAALAVERQLGKRTWSCRFSWSVSRNCARSYLGRT